jgi:hypothetical protein
LRRRIDAADNALGRRLSNAREEFRTRLDKQLQVDRENARRLRRRDFWDKILIASSLPLFAAYGQPGNAFGVNNLTLTLSLLVWLVGDHVVEAVFGSRTRKSPYVLHDADAWSYIAPLANVLAAWWLLDDRQHERFVTGITTVKLEKREVHMPPSGPAFYRYRADVALKDLIGKDHFPDFETFKAVPAVATIRGVRLSPEGRVIDPRIERLAARVDAGLLTLSFRAVPQAAPSLAFPTVLGEIDIAWMVDTDKPSISGYRN